MCVAFIYPLFLIDLLNVAIDFQGWQFVGSYGGDFIASRWIQQVGHYIIINQAQYTTVYNSTLVVMYY